MTGESLLSKRLVLKIIVALFYSLSYFFPVCYSLSVVSGTFVKMLGISIII